MIIPFKEGFLPGVDKKMFKEVISMTGNMEYLSGIVERITYSNDEKGFCVIKIKAKGFS